MGWTWTRAMHYKNGKVDRKAECDELFAKGYTVLKSSMVGSVYYAAVKDERDGDVFAAVILTGTNMKDPYYNFGYKEMAEFWGPCECKCPVGILDMLTPTENETTNEWRKRCREYHASKRSPNTFKNVADGARAEWKATWTNSLFNEGEKVMLRKGRQNAWKHRSPWVWHIEGSAYCLKPSMVKEFKLVSA